MLGASLVRGLADCGKLENLGLGATRVSDAGIRQIVPRLRHLETLDLRDAPVGDECLAGIGMLPELRDLVLDGTRVTDAGIVRLATAPKLTYLSLFSTKVTGETLGCFRPGTFEMLLLNDNSATAAGLRERRRILIESTGPR
jgi:hypothetical protein